MSSRKIPPGKFPPIKLPPGKFLSENCHPENSHLEYSHPFHCLSSLFTKYFVHKWGRGVECTCKFSQYKHFEILKILISSERLNVPT